MTAEHVKALRQRDLAGALMLLRRFAANEEAQGGFRGSVGQLPLKAAVN